MGTATSDWRRAGEGQASARSLPSAKETYGERLVLGGTEQIVECRARDVLKKYISAPGCRSANKPKQQPRSSSHPAPGCWRGMRVFPGFPGGGGQGAGTANTWEWPTAGLRKIRPSQAPLKSPGWPLTFPGSP